MSNYLLFVFMAMAKYWYVFGALAIASSIFHFTNIAVCRSNMWCGLFADVWSGFLILFVMSGVLAWLYSNLHIQ